jgi:hypothetical protein
MRDPMALRGKQQIINSASPMASTINDRVSGNTRLRAILTRHSRDFIPTTDNGLNARHARLKRAVPAPIFKITMQIRHQRMAIDYTGGLTLDDTRIGFDIGFSGGRFSGADEPGRGIA